MPDCVGRMLGRDGGQSEKKQRRIERNGQLTATEEETEKEEVEGHDGRARFEEVVG
jgi:hypothetical protein